MSDTSVQPALGQAAWYGVCSAALGAISTYFRLHEEPLIRAGCLFGGVIASVLLLKVAGLLAGALASAIASGSASLFRYYGYRKLLAAFLAVSFIAGGTFAIFVLGLGPRRFWIVALPIALGIGVYLMPDAIERVMACPLVVRQFRSGGKPTEEFAGPVFIRKHSKPLSHFRHAKAGYLANARLMGSSLVESTVFPRLVWNSDPASEVNFAAIGTGKTTEIITNACLWCGSAWYGSTKADIADALIGRRTDVEQWFGQNRRSGLSGIDPRGISRVAKHIPGGRTALLDPQGVSHYASRGQRSYHNILSDIDIRSPNAAAQVLSVANSSSPPNERANDPFFTNSTRGAIAMAIGFVLLTRQDPAERTMPYVFDLLQGIDQHGRADPDRFRKTLIEARKITGLNGLVAAGAAQLDEMGDKTYGSVMAEVRNALRWVMLMRDELSRPSTFSYLDMAKDGEPLSVFLIQPSLAPTDSAAYMRTHMALALNILKTKPRPAVPTLIVADEFRQYGKGIDEITSGSMILRSYGIKLNLYIQNYSALVSTVGEQGAHEICSSSTERYYGINDIDTAERLSRRLGMREGSSGRNPLVSPQDILRELDPASSLQYCLPYAGPPMRLERLAHKSIRTREGLRLRGLGLDGLYDEF